MNFKEALNKYEALKQEIKDIKEAIGILSHNPQDKANTNIAVTVLTLTKEKKENELLSFEKLIIEDRSEFPGVY